MGIKSSGGLSEVKWSEFILGIFVRSCSRLTRYLRYLSGIQRWHLSASVPPQSQIIDFQVLLSGSFPSTPEASELGALLCVLAAVLLRTWPEPGFISLLLPRFCTNAGCLATKGRYFLMAAWHAEIRWAIAQIIAKQMPEGSSDRAQRSATRRSALLNWGQTGGIRHWW